MGLFSSTKRKTSLASRVNKLENKLKKKQRIAALKKRLETIKNALRK